MAAPVAQAQEKPVDLSGWKKFCGKQKNGTEQCDILLQVVDQQNRPVAGIKLTQLKGKPAFIVFSVPTAIYLPPGLRFKIDDGKNQAAVYEVCMPNACFARTKADAALIKALKKGSNLTLTLLNTQRRPFNVPVPLKGFTAVYDGKPMDPKVLQQALQRQRKKTVNPSLESAIQKKAEETRKKLLEKSKQ